MRRAPLVVFLAWGCASLVWSAAQRLGHPASGIPPDVHPVLWREGNLAVVRLEKAVDAARDRIQPGAVVAFACARDGDTFYGYHWASYLLPEHQVLALRDVPDLRGVHYVLTDKTPATSRGLKLVSQLPAGWMLFRVRGEALP